MSAQIFIGTSGWSFQDWKGVFYPEKISSDEMITFYVQHFRCAELNTTYYQIPPYSMFENLVENTPDAFEITVKLNRHTTHSGENPMQAARDLNNAVTPLKEAQKFAGFLGQFPSSFKNNESNRGFLHALRTEVPDVPIFVEFRHTSWLEKPLYKFLHQNRLGYVCVDEPPLKGLLPPQTITTTDTGYVRFHGRNTGTWWNAEKGDRYDYSYTTEELQEWVERLEQMRTRVSKLYIFFNNCHHGQAPLNARQMQAFFS